MINNIYSRKYSILIGGLPIQAITNSNWIPSTSYYQDDMTWCIANAAKLESWRNFFVIFSDELWIFIIFIGCISGTILFLFARDEQTPPNYGYSMLISFAATVFIPIKFNPKTLFVRLYYLIMLAYGILFMTTFCAFLLQTLTKIILKPQLKTFNEILYNQYELTGDKITLQFYNQIKDQYVSGFHCYLFIKLIVSFLANNRTFLSNLQ